MNLRELTTEELEFEISTLSNNIDVLKGGGCDTSASQKRLALYRSRLHALRLAEINLDQEDTTEKNL